ncbi:unnamed protein product [Rotaria sp. Silwood1]|nr:unnamed protein product [Rotaria sp. Silwood1]CAF4782786.1 unnamed protein product [Rotaria sp. Silwood1]CAF4945362.1 unnamed protein product [Rotaria sp. Silwood1]
MLRFILILLIGLSNLPKTNSCVAQWGQCGGISYTGSKDCCAPYVCQYSNPWYSQCLTGQTQSRKTTISPRSRTSVKKGCSALWQQCGGIGWTGPTCCDQSTCVVGNPYYSQCLQSGVSSSSSFTSSSTVSTVTKSSPNDGHQPGVTTRYWDCCKASCGWSYKASVTSPVRTCAQNGITPVDSNTQSGCTGGSAYMCNNQQPWNVSSTLSYGYAAAHIAGKSEADWCCACYSLIFTSGPVVGKKLIVQVTNTGDDLGNNHFDLQMPGGGVGIFDGCSRQFPGSYSWGQRYGGVSQRSDCANLPRAIQAGCYWRFDWFMNADNPTISFKQVPCPSVLTANTQCIRS